MQKERKKVQHSLCYVHLYASQIADSAAWKFEKLQRKRQLRDATRRFDDDDADVDGENVEGIQFVQLEQKEMPDWQAQIHI